MMTEFQRALDELKERSRLQVDTDDWGKGTAGRRVEWNSWAMARINALRDSPVPESQGKKREQYHWS